LCFNVFQYDEPFKARMSISSDGLPPTLRNRDAGFFGVSFASYGHHRIKPIPQSALFD
jgi:hypothetical protein